LLIFYGRVEVFWLFGFNDISRRQIVSYSQFKGVKLKLRSRYCFWGNVCFCTSNGSFKILKTAGFRKWINKEKNPLVSCRKPWIESLTWKIKERNK
jgi:hypothetical protein